MENPDIAPNAARCRFRRIVVKVGSNVLTRADGTLDTDRMAALADQWFLENLVRIHRAGEGAERVGTGDGGEGRPAALRVDGAGDRGIHVVERRPRHVTEGLPRRRVDEGEGGHAISLRRAA